MNSLGPGLKARGLVRGLNGAARERTWGLASARAARPATESFMRHDARKRQTMGEEKCGTCNGQGGWWDHGNGQVGKPPKQWIKCHDCSGTGAK